MKKDRLLCCDWGTSNFRLYLLDIGTAAVIGWVQSNQGIAATFDAWQMNGTDRVQFFRSFLKEQIQRLSKECGINLANLPIVLSGMASASIGMEEVPYTSVPFSIKKPALNVKYFPSDAIFSNEIYLYGGLKTTTDVMRGEEVQLLGVSHLINASACVCILPGTHSKHIWIENQTVVDFQTFMTGECFQILGGHSILKGSIRLDDVFDTAQQASFKEGVLKAQSGNLLHNLFSVRTNSLLKGLSETANYYYLSGLLIGQELRSLQDFTGQLLLMGDKQLAIYYQQALSILSLDEQLIVVTPADMERCIPNAHLKLYQNI